MTTLFQKTFCCLLLQLFFFIAGQAQEPSTPSGLQDSLLVLNNSILTKPSFDAYYNRGLIMFQLGDFTGAIRDFTSATEIDPTWSFAFPL